MSFSQAFVADMVAANGAKTVTVTLSVIAIVHAGVVAVVTSTKA